MTEATTQTRFRVEGMDCAGCATKIDTAVRRFPGVADVMVSVTAGTMVVRHTAESDLDALQERVTGLGYGIAPSTPAVKPAGTAAHDHSHNRDDDHDHNHSHDLV
jgi:Zn2+/Cd2+-exporting ATPase